MKKYLIANIINPNGFVYFYASLFENKLRQMKLKNYKFFTKLSKPKKGMMINTL